MLDSLWLTQLKDNGYRLTVSRRAVVDVMESAVRAMTPVDIFDAARKKDPQLGLVTVYRTLDKLVELNLIQRVHQEQGCQAFLRAGVGHQHLIFCERCGRAVLFEGDDLATLYKKIASQTGFEIKDHWLQVSGVCAECQ